MSRATASANATLAAFLTRLFYSTHFDKTMSFLTKSIALGKEAYGLPEKEAPCRTSFIR